MTQRHYTMLFRSTTRKSPLTTPNAPFLRQPAATAAFPICSNTGAPNANAIDKKLRPAVRLKAKMTVETSAVKAPTFLWGKMIAAAKKRKATFKERIADVKAAAGML
ncbi:MAG: hypothetical protein KIG62_10735, partial [Oscillospiraceae bacterium]|nr:hypothetical protein [Oscillospiraceae bacterium]